jgi:hypothetical protein
MSFNVLLFSYYSLAPFIFKEQQYSSYIFGYSSIILAAGTFVGAKLNRFLILRNIAPRILVNASVAGSFIASVFVWILSGYGIYFLIPYFFIVMAFSMAIPNILSTALIHYKNETGSAGFTGTYLLCADRNRTGKYRLYSEPGDFMPHIFRNWNSYFIDFPGLTSPEKG